MKPYLEKLCGGHGLTREEAREALRIIMDGQAADAQIGALLVAMKLKGVTAEELLGFVEAMRQRCVPVRVDDPAAIDMCGTGGDGTGTFNVSTAAALVAAGAGATVAKHGNRSVSSPCGSADVLEALGVRLEATPQEAGDCINRIGIGFLFAPAFHPALKHAAKVRRELGMKTFFNLMGPLGNPAGVRRQLLGACRRDADLVAGVLAQLPTERAFVVNSRDGLDEISLGATTDVIEVRGGRCDPHVVEPESLGLSRASIAEIRGGDSRQNAQIILRVLGGAKGPHRDVVLANAAYGLLAAGKAASAPQAVAMAVEAIDSGRAMAKLEAWRTWSRT